MMLLDLAQRVVARFAARRFDFRPLPVKPCKFCGGEGVEVEEKHRVKSLCVRCWGTGTDPELIKVLQEKVNKLTEVYRAKDKTFQIRKQELMGRGGRELGDMGMELQTIKGEWIVRESQLKEELERATLGKQMARIVGAAAR